MASGKTYDVAELRKIKALLDCRNLLALRKVRRPDWRERIVLRREMLNVGRSR